MVVVCGLDRTVYINGNTTVHFINNTAKGVGGAIYGSTVNQIIITNLMFGMLVHLLYILQFYLHTNF